MLQYFNAEKINAQFVKGDSGSYVDGVWTPVFNAAVDIKIIAPQPLTANDLQMLPSGEHVQNFVVTWLDSAIAETREYDKDADRIIIGSKTFKIFQVDDRTTLGKYYRCILREIRDDN